MLLLLLSACGSAPEIQAEPALAAPTDLLVILVDTLRADALAKAHTPVIDALITQGSNAEHAWSSGTWTVPSIFSLFTGLSVREHGWDEPSARIGHYPQLAKIPNLPTTLKNAGFHTAGFYANPYLDENLGMERGFESWHRVPDTQMAKRLKEHLQHHDEDGARHFRYIHLLGPHSPLRPSESARERWQVDKAWLDGKKGLRIGAAKRNRKEGVREAYRRAYHAVIEDTDARIGEILAALGPARASTWIVLTSDHGELLGEHNRVGHGRDLYQGLTHIPFIVTPPPGIQALELPPVLNNAVLPAVASKVLNLPSPWRYSLESPLPLIAQREGYLALSPDGQTKGIWHSTEQEYDLSLDPTETSSTPITQATQDARETWMSTTPKGKPSLTLEVIDNAAQQALKALGYQDE